MIKPWLLAARPKTLSAAVAPVIVATALAYRVDHDLPWRYAFLALVGALLIQVATNFINDAIDYKKGADNTDRLGPVRVTQAGLLSAEAVLLGAYVCLFAAAAIGVPLIIRGGWPLLVIGVASIIAAYTYTGGPYPLAYHGLGEIFVLMFFGVIATGGTYYLLTLRYGTEVLIAGVAVGLLSVAILAINNLRDVDGDRASNKRTIAVRVGPQLARVEIAIAVLIPFILVVVVAAIALHPPFLLVLIALPMGVVLIQRVRHSSGRDLNRCLALAGALQWVFSGFFVLAALL